MIPIGSSAPKDGTYWLVVTLIVLCVGVFLWEQALPPRDAHALIARYALIPLRYAEPKWALVHGLDPTNYTPFVAMAFLHGGWLHLIINMWTLWLFGRAVEGRLGALRFAVLYALCTLLASGAHFLANTDSATPTLGASGAIAGVLGAHAMLFPKARIVIVLPIWFIPLFFRLSAMIFVAIWLGLQLLQGAGSLLSPTIGAGIAWWAHIGGFLAGLLFVHILAPPGGPTPDRPEPQAEPREDTRPAETASEAEQPRPLSQASLPIAPSAGVRWRPDRRSQ
ncbi:MAG: rhomboid family intramembrane serine protease [Alphaproteobacteria bacterium]|jgi:membrane associated rhomboid family serine protease|nr:rhomboid family intramembrane serine protease [Alphaproteobacteria bacterium]